MLSQKRGNNACFKCGSLGHFKSDCPKNKGAESGQAGRAPGICPQCEQLCPKRNPQVSTGRGPKTLVAEFGLPWLCFCKGLPYKQCSHGNEGIMHVLSVELCVILKTIVLRVLRPKRNPQVSAGRSPKTPVGRI